MLVHEVEEPRNRLLGNLPQHLVADARVDVDLGPRNVLTDTRAPELDAELIVLAVTGIGRAVLAGGTTREAAVELLDHLLDRVFTDE
ncbi:hypothetical protein ACIRRA_09730 [Nocardia sp. NPDC101769]|uniref:hypothetical protein n=1 Tax=Nocardia sp. NPDC101769 TaxID=3364333 RepID=UPI003811D63A